MLPSVDHAEVVSVIHDEDQLRNYGVCRAKLPFTEMELRQWASVSILDMFKQNWISPTNDLLAFVF